MQQVPQLLTFRQPTRRGQGLHRAAMQLIAYRPYMWLVAWESPPRKLGDGKASYCTAVDVHSAISQTGNRGLKCLLVLYLHCGQVQCLVQAHQDLCPSACTSACKVARCRCCHQHL